MKIIFLLLSLILYIPGWGQTRTITGRVINSKDQEPVRHASVRVMGSASGTVTNYLGYFRIELANSYNALLISHVRYKTGKVVVPEVDRFTIELTPETTVLKDLDLATFPKEYGLSDRAPEERGPRARNAVPKDGWALFYQELGNKITRHKKFIRKSSGIDLEFKINKDGKVSGIEVSPDSALHKEIILHSFLQLNDWKPALQNGVAVPQDFRLHISSGERRTPARPKGGTMAVFLNYMGQHLKYPVAARKMGIEGRVSVRGIIGKDGVLREVEVIRGIGYGCDEMVAGLLKDFTDWQPARYKGHAVAQRIIVPVKFEITGQPGGRKSAAAEGKESLEKGSGSGGFYQGPEASEPGISEQVLSEIIVRTYKGTGKDVTGRKIKIEMPRFSRDAHGLENYIEKNKKVKTPVFPNSKGSIVSLVFTIDAEGNVENVKVTGSLGEPFDSEALRLFTEMPAWIPGKHNGKPVSMTGITAAVDFGNIPDHRIEAARANFNRGVQFYNKGKLKKALRQFTRAIEKNPTVLNYYYNKAVTLIDMDKPACETLQEIKDYDQEALDLFHEYCEAP